MKKFIFISLLSMSPLVCDDLPTIYEESYEDFDDFDDARGIEQFITTYSEKFLERHKTLRRYTLITYLTYKTNELKYYGEDGVNLIQRLRLLSSTFGQLSIETKDSIVTYFRDIYNEQKGDLYPELETLVVPEKLKLGGAVVKRMFSDLIAQMPTTKDELIVHWKNNKYAYTDFGLPIATILGISAYKKKVNAKTE